MGKPKLEREHKNSLAVKSTTVTTNGSVTPKDLIKQAEEKLICLEPKEALRLYKSALNELNQLAPSDENRELTIEALQSSAYILLDHRKEDEARQNLEKAVELSPDEGHEKYMYLAQISRGQDSVKLYNKGIEIIKKSIETTDDSDASTKDQLTRALSNAYCAIAELYTTDLCDEPDAETCCQEAIQCALNTDEANPQAWYISANFLTIKSENEKAKEAIEKCLSLFWPQVEPIASVLRARDEGVADDEDLYEIDIEDISGIPYDGHVQIAEMLIELEMYERAADILRVLLAEDGECIEVLRLLTVVGEVLWKETHPKLLRLYAEDYHELAVKLGDAEAAEEGAKLLGTLPSVSDDEDESDNENEKNDESASLSSSSSSDTNEELMDMN